MTRRTRRTQSIQRLRPNPVQERAPPHRANPLNGCVGELLATQGRFVHKATLGDGKHGRSLVVMARSLRILLATAGPSGSPRRTGTGRSPRGNRHGTGLGTEFKTPGSEFLEGP